MSTWSLVGYFSLAAAGALLFLSTVADEMVRAEADLQVRKAAWDRQRAQGEEAAEVRSDRPVEPPTKAA